MQKSSNYPTDASIQEAMRLAQSQTGQKLLAKLQEAEPDTLQSVMAQAESGDMEQLKKSMSQLLSNPDIQALLKQLGG